MWDTIQIAYMLRILIFFQFLHRFTETELGQTHSVLGFAQINPIIVGLHVDPVDDEQSSEYDAYASFIFKIQMKSFFEKKLKN